MSKTFNSFNALKKAIQKEVQDAMNEVVNTSFVNAHSNVDQFYNSPEGRYKRTGQLAESPEMSLSGGGGSYHGEIRLDTGFRYHPSGRDTQTIYGYAEENGLLGNGGFWQQTKQDIQININEAFSKRFE